MSLVYIAGAMRGKPYFNRGAFDEAAAILRAEGHEVFNPVEYSEMIYGSKIYAREDGDEAKTAINPRLVFGADLAFLCGHAEAIMMLPGWRESKGATAEHAVAVALGLEVWEL